MLTRIVSSCCVAALAACASAPGRPGERGLAELRAALSLEPVVGHVERGGGRTRLVLAKTGTVIATAPTPDAKTPCGEGNRLRTVMFEGDPGAALTFGRDTVTLWEARLDRCPVASDVFSTESPAWKPLLVLGPDASSEETTLPLADGVPPIGVVITGESATVSHGGEQTVVRFPTGARCAFSAAAEVVDRGDGVTGLRISYVMDSNLDYESCDEALEYASEQTRTSGSTWLDVGRDGRIRIVATDETPPEDRGLEGHRWHVFDVPGGTLEYDEVSMHQVLREGGSDAYTWNWTLVVGQTRVVLAQGVE